MTNVSNIAEHIKYKENAFSLSVISVYLKRYDFGAEFLRYVTETIKYICAERIQYKHTELGCFFPKV